MVGHRRFAKFRIRDLQNYLRGSSDRSKSPGEVERAGRRSFTTRSNASGYRLAEYSKRCNRDQIENHFWLYWHRSDLLPKHLTCMSVVIPGLYVAFGCVDSRQSQCSIGLCGLPEELERRRSMGQLDILFGFWYPTFDRIIYIWILPADRHPTYQQIPRRTYSISTRPSRHRAILCFHDYFELGRLLLD